MKLMIDIDENKYEKIKEYFANDDCGLPTDLAIAKGTPIVQCKECDYWEKSENSLQGRCCLLQMYPTGEWFCGNAKRKENLKIETKICEPKEEEYEPDNWDSLANAERDH